MNFIGALALGLSASALFAASPVSADTVQNYTVQAGDTLNKIAKDVAPEQNTSDVVASIAAANGIQNVDLIFVGQTLDLSKLNNTVSSVQATAPVQSAPVAQAPKVQAPVAPAAPVAQAPVQKPATPAPSSGSVHDRFIAAGGTERMWTHIVMPESGGNPDITSPNGYHGLGQTKQSWGYGSVESQTQGMINYANSRYGSVDNAIAFRLANHWW